MRLFGALLEDLAGAAMEVRLFRRKRREEEMRVEVVARCNKATQAPAPAPAQNQVGGPSVGFDARSGQTASSPRGFLPSLRRLINSAGL